jgi:uncharacterized repeat protein (TIGR03987 family)
LKVVELSIHIFVVIEKQKSMELDQIDIHYLIAAICVISSVLVFYSIGVWGERLQKKLKFWHIAFFLIGLIADTVGTSLMEHIAELTHLHDEIHTVTGTIAILLMFVHALWAIWTYVKGSAKAKKHFNRFSIVVWCIWLIPYLIGVYMGMRLHP